MAVSGQCEELLRDWISPGDITAGKQQSSMPKEAPITYSTMTLEKPLVYRCLCVDTPTSFQRNLRYFRTKIYNKIWEEEPRAREKHKCSKTGCKALEIAGRPLLSFKYRAELSSSQSKKGDKVH